MSNTGMRARGGKGWFRRLLPGPLIPVPNEGELKEARTQSALGIAMRQGEGSVLLSAGKIDMSGVDLLEEDTESELAAG